MCKISEYTKSYPLLRGIMEVHTTKYECGDEVKFKYRCEWKPYAT